MAQSSLRQEGGGPQARYRGDLAETTLPEILFKVYRFHVPGVLEATSGEARHGIFVRAGQIVHARSTDRGASLGAHLLRQGLLTPAQYDEVMREREASSRRLGVLVVQRGLLAPDRVRQAIQEQTEAIVWSLFAWPRGTVEFTIGEWEEKDLIPIHLPIRRVIIEGIRTAMAAKPLFVRLGGRQTVLEPTHRLEEVVEIGLDEREFSLLSMVDGTRDLYTLCAEGPGPPEDNVRLLYAFRVLELVRPARFEQ